MELKLHRLNTDGDSTVGILHLDSKFNCYTLEDEARKIKIKGETRIPAGRYEIKYREVLSGMTVRYRERYKWFKWHLELQDVPGFENIYIHIGNDDDDTDGCILVGNTQNSNVGMLNGFVGQSRNAFQSLYEKVSLRLEGGERVFITVFDEDWIHG